MFLTALQSLIQFTRAVGFAERMEEDVPVDVKRLSRAQHEPEVSAWRAFDDMLRCSCPVAVPACLRQPMTLANCTVQVVHLGPVHTVAELEGMLEDIDEHVPGSVVESQAAKEELSSKLHPIERQVPDSLSGRIKLDKVCTLSCLPACVTLSHTG